MKCWNCLSPQELKDYNCTQCGQTLKPNTMQRVTARSRLDFLLHEAEEWEFLGDERHGKLKQIYESRKTRLDQAAQGSTPDWPDTDWTDPIWGELSERAQSLVESKSSPNPELVTAPLPEALPQAPKSLSEALPQAPESTADAPNNVAIAESIGTASVDETFSATKEVFVPTEPGVAEKLMAETDIRWFHSLGALLVVAAVIGWLRVSWDDYGKALTGILIMLSPVVCQLTAQQLKKSVPLSARLLSILGNLLTAPALLAVDIFGFLPEGIPSDLYWTLALTTASALLNWQAHTTHEKVPLFIGALCAITAGWSLGAMATAGISLGLAFLFSQVKLSPEDDEEQRLWKLQVERVGFGAGLFGSAATLLLFNPENHPLAPMVMFGASLLYLHLPTLTKSVTSTDKASNRVVLQASFTVIGSFLMRWLLGVPAAGVGLYILVAVGLFLSARPDDERGLLALRLGSLLGLVGLLVGFFSGLGTYFDNTSPSQPEVFLRFLLAIGGAVFYTVMSRKERLQSQRSPLFLGALISIFGGWVHLFLFYRSQQNLNGQLPGLSGWDPLLYGLLLLTFLFIVGSRWLRRHERLLTETFSLGIAICLTAIFTLFSVAGRSLLNDGHVSVSNTGVALCGLLALLALAWERGWILPRLRSDEGSPSALQVEVPQLLEIFLPRIAVWSSVLLSLHLGFSELHTLGLGQLAALFVLTIVGPKAYRRPAVEIAWIVSVPTHAYLWEQPQALLVLLCPLVLMLFAWAGRELREAGFWAATGMSAFTLLSASSDLPALSLLILPLTYLVAITIRPLEQASETRKPGSERYGFDLLANLSLFVVGSKLELGDQTMLMAGTLPLICGAILWASEREWGQWGLHKHTGIVLTGSSFLWSLGASPKESGILLLLLAIAAGVTKQPKTGPIPSIDVVTGSSILGAAWLTAEAHYAPNGLVLVVGILASEILSIVLSKWKPNVSIPLLSGLLLLVYSEGNLLSPELEPALLAAILMGSRGLRETQTGLFTAGLGLYLLFSNALLDHYQLGGRLIPAAVVFAVMGLWLWNQPEHPSRSKFQISPPTVLRLSLALTVMPRLLEFLVGQELMFNFVFILVAGSLCIAVSGACQAYVGLGELLKQSGGWILTAWTAVSMLRVAAILPWQGATLLLGLALLVAGVMKEKRRKG